MSGTRVEVRVVLVRATEEATPPRKKAREAVPRIVRLLALAHRWHGQLERGEVESQAEIAERTGLTRARVTQIMDLRWLAPVVQESLACCADAPSEEIERQLREAAAGSIWPPHGNGRGEP